MELNCLQAHRYWGAADVLEPGLDAGTRIATLEEASLGGGLSSVRVGPSGMYQELPFNWTSFDAMPVMPLPQTYTYGRGPLLQAPKQSTVTQQVPQKAPVPAANPGRQYDPVRPPTKTIDNVDDLTKEESGNEYFYRAMSRKEFAATGGLIQTREDRNSIPFITQNLDYLRNRNSFIWSEPKKYQIIVKYTVPKGTTNYLENVSVWGFKVSAESAAKRNQVIKKEETYTIFGGITVPNRNFGFPGKTGNKHFNPKISKIEVIDTSVPGIKKK